MKKVIYFLYISILMSQIDTTVIINASNYYEWVYFSFEENNIVNINNPDSSLAWDIALQRKHIKTNSGLSGIGNGGAYVDSSMTWIEEWESINTLPDNIELEIDTLLNDFYNPITHMFEEGIKNPALNSWGWFDENYHMNVNHYVLFVRSANGEELIKFWPYNYYNQNGQGAHISIRYQAGIEFGCTSYGDVNFDGIINVVDIVSIINFIIDEASTNNSELICGDINQDGFINVVDIVAIVNIIIDSSY